MLQKPSRENIIGIVSVIVMLALLIGWKILF